MFHEALASSCGLVTVVAVFLWPTMLGAHSKELGNDPWTSTAAFAQVICAPLVTAHGLTAGARVSPIWSSNDTWAVVDVFLPCVGDESVASSKTSGAKQKAQEHLFKTAHVLGQDSYMYMA